MDFQSPPAGGKMDSATREQLMAQVKQQIALANAQELLQVGNKFDISLDIPKSEGPEDFRIYVKTSREPTAFVGDFINIGETDAALRLKVYGKCGHLNKMSEKCYKKCISKPGTTLDNSEQKCIAMCMDRYMDTWNLVSRVYAQRLQRESQRMS